MPYIVRRGLAQILNLRLINSYFFTVEIHELEDGVVEVLDQEIAATLEGCRILESKSSQIEDLKNESKKLDKVIDELCTKITQLEQRLKETNQKEKYNLQRISEASRLLFSRP